MSDAKAPLKILSFNWHEPYLCALARTGHSFDVAEPRLGRDGARAWDRRLRPVPENLRLITELDARLNLDEGWYDLVLCHNFRDVAQVAAFEAPIALLFHNLLTGELAIGGRTVERRRYLDNVAPLAERAERMIFVSEAKRQDWGYEGRVIVHGVDPGEFAPHTGGTAAILRVGNHFTRREAILGWRQQERLCEGLPSTIVGVNPDLPQARTPASYDELKALYAAHRVYLNTTVAGNEDGYNLSMLEAMAAGMPVVSLASPTSPLTDGVEGYVSGDVSYLRQRLGALLAEPERANAMGRAARALVAERFSMGAFVAAWNETFRAAARPRARTFL